MVFRDDESSFLGQYGDGRNIVEYEFSLQDWLYYRVVSI